MKKTFTILALFFALFAIVGCTGVNALETTTTYATTIPDTNTTIPETTLTSIADGDKVYVYSDYDDLVQQIYEDVYADIYDSVYADVSEMLTEDLYEAIYAQVTENLNEILTSEQIGVYIEDLQSQIYDVADIVSTSVVGVSTYQGTTGTALGSGVVYYYDSINDVYYLITNEHVVSGGDNYKVVFEDGDEVVATLIGVDEDVDIAILSFSGSAANRVITVSVLGDSDALDTATIVIAAGNPQGYDFYGSMTMGIVAGVNRDVDGNGVVGYIQHDASINAGNSGGPLYNLDGEVVGINVAKFASTDIEGMGFAIPINLVKQVISSIAPNTLE